MLGSLVRSWSAACVLTCSASHFLCNRLHHFAGHTSIHGRYGHLASRFTCFRFIHAPNAPFFGDTSPSFAYTLFANHLCTFACTIRFPGGASLALHCFFIRIFAAPCPFPQGNTSRPWSHGWTSNGSGNWRWPRTCHVTVRMGQSGCCMGTHRVEARLVSCSVEMFTDRRADLAS